ncbi:MAG: DUF3641 domain-containing protein, partial [Merismopedia sp. SIO2A8]|nr:DUF3641 domain-containing protein [Merismopedia sp. SIO2A8]
YTESIQAIQRLNALGYGRDPNLVLDLVYNPSLPTSENFALPPAQAPLQADYQQFLAEQFDITFNHLFTITNIPIGRTKQYLHRQKLHAPYLKFLEEGFNASTVANLMCRNQLSIDYLGHIYDCDFNQMEQLPATTPDGTPLTVQMLLDANTLDLIHQVRTAPFCYGCTAGSGSSCGGSLV